MKNKLTIILSIVFCTNIFAQKYEKTYRQNINYNTGNQNGKDLVLDFACKYDAFMQEPLFSSRTKIISEGDFIVFNGQKYFRNEIGNELFDKIEIGLVNVSFDIYQGSIKITTVSLSNEIAASFIPGSPEWDEMWPGISGERVKEIWKEGYSIRNARLYDVEFRGFYALENYIREKKQNEEFENILSQLQTYASSEKSIEELSEGLEKVNNLRYDSKTNEQKQQVDELKEEINQLLAKKNEEKRKEEEKAKEEKSLEENKNILAENTASESKSKSEVSKENKKAEEDKRKAEEKRKKEEEAEKRQIEETKRIIREQRAERERKKKEESKKIAIGATTSQLGFLYLLGGFIYSQPTVYQGDIFDEDYLNHYFGIELGYTTLYVPILFNSENTTYNEFDGNYYSSEGIEASDILTLNLKTKFKLGIEHDNIGGYAFVGGEAGWLLGMANLNYEYGVRAFAGLSWIKAMGEYSFGERSLYENRLVNPDEAGEGYTNFGYSTFKYGPMFSWKSDRRPYLRHYISFGIVDHAFDYNKNLLHNTLLLNDNIRIIIPDEKLDEYNELNNLNDKDDWMKNRKYLEYQGYFFEWKNDHHGILSIVFYPVFPHSGEATFNINDVDRDGGMYIEVGYLKNFDWYGIF